MFWLKTNKKLFFFIFVIFIFSLPSIFALFHSGFFESDDGEWMIIRFSAFHEAFRDGQFPVRFLGRLNNGYGYPVANFLYPGFMYLGEPFKLIGFSFVNVIKIIFGFSLLGSLIFTFLWLRRFFDEFSAIIGSLFYLYTPYHLFDIYKRGSVGEVLALAVIPFILLQTERKSIFWGSIGTAFLIISHNTLAFLFLPIIIFYMLLDILTSKEKKALIYRYTSILVLGLAMSAFFWIPAFFELKYTNFSDTVISNFSEYFADQNLIGLSSFLVLLFILVLFITKIIKASKHRLTLLFFIIGLFSLLFSLEISQTFWKVLPVSFIQFPFRLLSYLILSVSFLAACAVSAFHNKKKYLISAFLLIVLFISSYPYLTPMEYFNKEDTFYSTNMATTTVRDEYLPKWVKNNSNNIFKEKVEIHLPGGQRHLEGEGKIENLSYNSKRIQFDFDSQENSLIRINTIYYPGWKASVNNQPVQVLYSNDQGVMEVKVPKGQSSVRLFFTETPLRLFADTITILSLLLLMVVSVYNKFVKRHS